MQTFRKLELELDLLAGSHPCWAILLVEPWCDLIGSQAISALQNRRSYNRYAVSFIPHTVINTALITQKNLKQINKNCNLLFQVN